MKVIRTLLFCLVSLGLTVCPSVSMGQSAGDGQVVMVVVGAAGESIYGAQFSIWADLWKQACAKSGAKFVGIGLDEPNQADELADCEKLKAALASEPNDAAGALWLVLIGHGTYDGRTAKFNLRGSDVSADDLSQWLEPFNRPVAVINVSSSSSPFLKKLSRPGRIVITATKSGFEQNFARFGRFISSAIVQPEADLDKDGQISLLEAFLTASHDVDEFYAEEGRLATERALLDDNGDGLGTRADWFQGLRPVKKAGNKASLDGYRAHQFHLLYSQTEQQMPDVLRARRNRLELEVMKLRDGRDRYSEQEYYTRLEALLLEIARIYEQADSSEKP